MTRMPIRLASLSLGIGLLLAQLTQPAQAALFGDSKSVIDLRNKQEALQQFDRIFSPKVKMALLNTTFDDAFATCQGVAIASGTIWFQPYSENDSELRIYGSNEN